MGSRTARCLRAGAVLLVSAFAWAGDGQIDIATLPYVISTPGSYVVVADLGLAARDSDGILIVSSNVTLDLNGHTLSGPGRFSGGSGAGVRVYGLLSGVVIRNGIVRGWPTVGVDGGSDTTECQFEQLQCLENGWTGIVAGDYCTVRNCIANRNLQGIYARVSCVVEGNVCCENDAGGIYADTGNRVLGNTCSWNGGDGIGGASRNRLADNTCNSNWGRGITLESLGTVRGNTCVGNVYDGISVVDSCVVEENACHDNGQVEFGAGIVVNGVHNRVERNLCTGNGVGLMLNQGYNYVSENILKINGSPLGSVPGNQLNMLITELPYAISFPGTYRVAGPLSATGPDMDGITLYCDDVTLDLGGHTLTGAGKESGSSGSCIVLNHEISNLEIRNGVIRDWRWDGVDAWNAQNSRFENLRILGNGQGGLSCGDGAIVTAVEARDNGGNGIYAYFSTIIRQCTATSNGQLGINAQSGVIEGCAASYNGWEGIQGRLSTVRGNTCLGNKKEGIDAGDYSNVEGNCCVSNGTAGILVNNECRVVGNQCAGALTGAGIQLTGHNSSVEGNLVTTYATGILCDPTTGNYLASNRASNNTTNYNIAPGNTVGTGDLANVSY